MNKRTRLFKSALSVLLSLLMLMTFFLGLVPVAQALEEVPPPIDPQSWQLLRDRTWDDFKPNPVINWMTEMNTAGIVRPGALRNPTAKTPIAGGLLMIEYLDRKFISRGEVGSDPLGYYLYNLDGSGLSDTKTNNPIYNVPQLVADEKYNGDVSKVTDADFAQWWANYLNKPQEINHGFTIDEAWRENSYGKWAVNLTPYGPYTIPYFEFETMGYDSSFQTYHDVPPVFRRGNGTSSLSSVSFSFDSVSTTLMDSLVSAGQFSWDNVDFFFWLHAGYDESGVWQEFGMNQFPTRKDIPYELGPGPRMKKVEQFFTENPSWLATYATRYSGATSTVNTSSGNVTVANFWVNERNKYNALVAAGTPELYEFHLSNTDWNWVDGYMSTETTKNTRYVNFTCWEAAVGEWSHMSNITKNGRTIRYSTQGENDGMSTFAHEFGHIANLGDNYGNPYTGRITALTEPWELMSRGSFAGPFGDHGRWSVPGIEAGSVPVHFMQRNKAASNYYDNNDLLIVSKQSLSTSPPVVAEIVARNVPLNNGGFYPWLNDYGLVSPNFYKGIRLDFGSSTWADQASRATAGFTNFRQAAAVRMHVEVVQRTGYDTYAPDDGVVISRTSDNGSSTGSMTSNYTSVIDSHNYDIALVDYTVPDGFGPGWDDHVSYPVGHAQQLYDAAFHAGLSTTDTGYYKSIYGGTDFGTSNSIIVAQQGPRYYTSESSGVTWQKGILKRGSIQQWEPQDGREIASGETVNEWHDTANNLHFYILAKHMNPGKYGDFLSYTVGLRHGAGTAVAGQLQVVPEVVEAETYNRVAVVNFKITNNNATAADIIRASVTGTMDTTLLNNLYAIKPGETVVVPVYVSLGDDFVGDDLAGVTVGLNVSSESNANNKASASVGAQEVIAYTVTFVDWDETELGTQAVVYNTAVEVPAAPVRFGYTFAGWSLDGETYDFDAPVTEDITLVAEWTRNPITYLRITDIQGNEALAVITVVRNSTVQLDYVINADAIREGIVWAVSNPAYAVVDNTGKLIIKNLPGTAILTAKDSLNGATSTVVLRII